MSSEMGSGEWQEICRAQGNNIWSMIIQLLQLAAKEHPEEFRRRRDGIAEALFSPELSGRSRGLAARCSSVEPPEPSGQHALEGSDRYLPSGWAPHESDAALGRKARTDTVASSALTHARTQSSEVGQDRDGTGQSPAVQSEHELHSSAALREDSRACERPVKLSESRSGNTCLAAPSHCQGQKSDVGGETRPVKDDHCSNAPSELRHKGSREGSSAERSEDHHESKSSHPTFTHGPPATWQNDVSQRPANADLEDLDVEGDDMQEFEAALDELASEETVMQRVVEIKKCISRKEIPIAELILRLKELQSLPVSLEILKETQVGKAVKVLAKKCPNHEVQERAKGLIRDWKNLVEETCSIPPATEQQAQAQAVQRQGDTTAPASHSGAQSMEEFDSLLPAPPLEDDVFQFANMELSNCLNDFDSIGSELSGSVASAGAHCLASKTPESHRMFTPSESSPCESNRPSTAGVAAHASGHPASVLSESVRKTEFGSDAVVGEQHSLRQFGSDPRPQSQSHRALDHRPRSAVAAPSALSKPAVPGRGVGPRHQGQHGEHAQDARRPVPPRPQQPMGSASLEKNRLEQSKRKLQECYNKLDEAKKTKSIQVMDMEPKKPSHKPPQKHQNFSRGAQRFGNRP